MEKMLAAFPEAVVGEDNDGQWIIYTGLHALTSEDNPTIPEGEVLIVPMPEDDGNESGWVIVDGWGKVVAYFVDEADRDEALATGDWPDDAEPAFIN